MAMPRRMLGGTAGDRREEGGRVGDGATILVKMVLGHPDLVEPHAIQQLHLLEHPAVELRRWPVQLRDIRRQVVGSELHRCALLSERSSMLGQSNIAVCDALCNMHA